MKRIEIQNFQE